MHEQDLERIALEELFQLRRQFLYPPVREVQLIETPNRELVSALVDRKCILNRSFIEQFVQERGVELRTVVRAAIARLLNRHIRVPESFAQALRLYVAMRSETPDAATAKRFLEIYMALWCESDLFECRGLKDELVMLYRASTALSQEELAKLEAHYRILVAVLQHRWGVDLGLPPHALTGWQPLARELASIDYLHSRDRVRDATHFARLFGRCCQVLQDQPATKDPEASKKQAEEPEPIHWPLEATIDVTTAAHDVAEGIGELFDELGGEAWVVLAEFTKDPYFLAQLGTEALLGGSKWLYYRERAEKYRLRLEPRPLRRNEGRAFRVSYKDFEVGDEFRRIAIFPSWGEIATPGLTKRWLLSGPESQLEIEESPDLLILIDSSSSMPDPNDLSYAVLSGFAAASAYLDRGSRVAVVNFSSGEIVLGFTRARDEIYKHLAARQWGGTTLRPEVVDRLLAKSQREVDILLISDLDLHNFREAVAGLARHARTHRLFIFLINPKNEAKVKEMREKLASAELHTVSNDEELVKLVLGSARRSFEAFMERRESQS